ncbi:YciI family protein [Actinocatenispora comari]|jgi:hypothetical protein|uniref:YCII-related domain-containing protein n=1 Tax=Actinocatenispora comari TaxID=2807577 RepID=A0A8J4A7Y9_9ACTN|nr:YciI family protein [Actinocatenispora comari]GIL26476.1 hypothetical protein NUM_17300 [Actinocatenispora comari]
MKYMILLFGSQRDYDAMAGRPGAEPAWTGEDVGKLAEFMESWWAEVVESGEAVDAQGLTAPVHARRVHLVDGVPVATDGPYAETQEVLAGYNIVDCASFDRAVEIAARLAATPHPEGALAGREWYVDVRPVASGAEESLA